ncbi:MAG TPA: PEP/pyruvate-binding domain-containing protein [Syntrophales bacterium]|nr:PEP/pyruvate-binding domain-containing protein [Syntrophales bacterium]
MQKWDRASTGLKGLDAIIDDLRSGDNVVWQVDDIKNYREFVLPFVNKAVQSGKRVVYIRFGNHLPLLGKEDRVKIHELKASTGFESFSLQLFQIIEKEGRETFYVFDCLSDLLSVWATDLMIGNFFLITCPYLYDMNTVAYFAILRNGHSFKTVARIRETTQVLLDSYNLGGKSCVHPLKAAGRYSPTMFFPHLRKDEEFDPIVNSSEAAELFLNMTSKGMGPSRRNLDYWDRLFIEVEDLLKKNSPARRTKALIDRVSRLLIGKEDRILAIAKKYLSLGDLMQVKDRMIGTGFIGGKTAGMLLARSILSREKPEVWGPLLEQHDSFYIGSDVFYSFIVQNGWWRLFIRQRTRDEYFSMAAVLREKILKGVFPDEIKEQFQLMLEYFGQSPIIVRSSSLLEDAFGNAFAGKYESIFCPNQGSPESRYEYFENAVRRIFASTMSENALVYRRRHNLDMHDELMSLLVQRVSGTSRKNYFYPEVAGVGFSRNPFVWKTGLDPEAGMLRIVHGLGTRAVMRDIGDYPRIVALDQPTLKPHLGLEETRKYSQHEVDVINLRDNRFESVPFDDLVAGGVECRLELIGTKDVLAGNTGFQEDGGSWVLTFDELLSGTSLTDHMSGLLKVLEKAYSYPVDIEFTLNFSPEGGFKINLLQCRPLQTKGERRRVVVPRNIERERVYLSQEGNFMGGSICQPVRKIVYVDPEKYTGLQRTDRYSVARRIGKIVRGIEDPENTPVFLIGPGRWGSSSPFMGIPVTFAEISRISILGEISFSKKGMEPDLSFGTHFFQDLVENDIFYVAIYSDRPDVIFSPDLPAPCEENSEIEERLQPVIKVYNVPDMWIMADILTRKIICFRGRAPAAKSKVAN